MELFSKIISLMVLLIPPAGVWIYYTRKRKKILSTPAKTKIEIANRNLDLKFCKIHYKNNFARYTFPALILATALSIGGSIMDKNEERLARFETEVNEIKNFHGSRIKKIEDYLWPSTGPTSPTIFERLDDLEQNRDEIQDLLLRITDPEQKLRKKVEELEQQIIKLREELELVKSRLETNHPGQATAEN